jgi:hypothetical protein
MVLFALAGYCGRHLIGRFQATVLLGALTIGEDRQSEIAEGLVTVLAAVVVLLLVGGLRRSRLLPDRVGLAARDPFDCPLVNRYRRP